MEHNNANLASTVAKIDTGLSYARNSAIVWFWVVTGAVLGTFGAGNAMVVVAIVFGWVLNWKCRPQIIWATSGAVVGLAMAFVMYSPSSLFIVLGAVVGWLIWRAGRLVRAVSLMFFNILFFGQSVASSKFLSTHISTSPRVGAILFPIGAFSALVWWWLTVRLEQKQVKGGSGLAL